MRRLVLDHVKLGIWLAALSLAAVALPVAAEENLLTNGGFDIDLSGWADSHDATYMNSTWDSRDADGGTGSASVENTSPGGGNGVVISQCIPVVAGRTYRWGTMLMIPSGVGQSADDTADSSVHWQTTADCSSSVGGPVSSGSRKGVFDVWRATDHTGYEAPGTAVAARFRLLVTKVGGGGSFEVLFDDAYFEEGPIFVSTFETGDPFEWSVVVGGPPFVLVDSYDDDSSCSALTGDDQRYLLDKCYRAKFPYYFKFDCTGNTFSWYSESSCNVVSAVGCAQGVCCANTADGASSLEWTCP